MLVKNAQPLELMEKIDTLVVDKTGTLTEGKPRLVGVTAIGDVTEDEPLQRAVGLELGSEHPLAAASVAGAEPRGFKISPAMDFDTVPGAAARQLDLDVGRQASRIEGDPFDAGSAPGNCGSINRPSESSPEHPYCSTERPRRLIAGGDQLVDLLPPRCGDVKLARVKALLERSYPRNRVPAARQRPVA